MSEPTHERLFVIAPNVWKLRVGTRGKGNAPELAVGIMMGWSESPAMARGAGELLAKSQLSAMKGYRDHAAAVKEVPEVRLQEWAARRGYIDPETFATVKAATNAVIEELREENRRLRKKAGGKGRRLLLLEEEGDEPTD
jgi:hypothetical protein